MSLTFLWPAWLAPETFGFDCEEHQVAHRGLYSRSVQVRELDVARWVVSMIFPMQDRWERAAVEAFIHRLRGQVNTVALWDLREERATPRGSLRGNPALSVKHAQGVQVLSALATPGEELWAGDRVGLLAQIFEVAADCVADPAGVIAIPVNQRTWAEYPAGATLIWNRPVTRFRLANTSAVRFRTTFGDYAEGWQLDLVQDVDPALINAIEVSPARGRAVQKPVFVSGTEGIVLNVNNAGISSGGQGGGTGGGTGTDLQDTGIVVFDGTQDLGLFVNLGGAVDYGVVVE